MKIIDVIQGSPEYHAAHRGVPSASQFHRIITPKTGKLSAQADGYINELIAEKYSLLPPLQYGIPKSPALAHGVECEAEARLWYELETNCDVRQVGFCLSDDGRFGCSPDGLIGEEGGLELKCPQGHIQAGYVRAGTLPDEYKAQVHGSLIVTGRKWWDFLSYSPGLPPLCIRVERTPYANSLTVALEDFWTRYQDALKLFAQKDEP